MPGLGPISLYVNPVVPISCAFHCELVKGVAVVPVPGTGAAPLRIILNVVVLTTSTTSCPTVLSSVYVPPTLKPCAPGVTIVSSAPLSTIAT